MKTEEKTRNFYVYTCETCGRCDQNKKAIELCEISHTCEHDNLLYKISGYGGLSVYNFCSKCGIEMGATTLYHVDDNSVEAKELYDILKRAEAKKQENE